MGGIRLYTEAMKYLNEERLQNLCMVEAIRLGHAEVLHTARQAVLLRETRSGAYMLYARNYADGRPLIEALAGQQVEALTVNQADLCRAAEEMLGLKMEFEFLHAAYLDDRAPKPTGRLEIREAEERMAPAITDLYPYLDEDGVLEHIRDGRLFAGYCKGEWIGFIGEHPEGSIGILEILPAHRRRGYGYDMENFMIARVYNRGQVPFVQVKVDNEVSISLQRKLGMTLADKSCFWLSKA